MTADEIRDTFGHNNVYATAISGDAEHDNRQLMRLQILALGELAAQLAERKPNTATS